MKLLEIVLRLWVLSWLVLVLLVSDHSGAVNNDILYSGNCCGVMFSVFGNLFLRLS